MPGVLVLITEATIEAEGGGNQNGDGERSVGGP